MNKKWYRWLKQATLGRHQDVKHVYSDGRQLLAGGSTSYTCGGCRWESRPRLAGEAETFVVDEGVERLPPFATAIPQNEPAFTLVVEWDRLLRALRGRGSRCA